MQGVAGSEIAAVHALDLGREPVLAGHAVIHQVVAQGIGVMGTEHLHVFGVHLLERGGVPFGLHGNVLIGKLPFHVNVLGHLAVEVDEQGRVQAQASPAPHGHGHGFASGIVELVFRIGRIRLIQGKPRPGPPFPIQGPRAVDGNLIQAVQAEGGLRQQGRGSPLQANGVPGRDGRGQYQEGIARWNPVILPGQQRQASPRHAQAPGGSQPILGLQGVLPAPGRTGDSFDGCRRAAGGITGYGRWSRDAGARPQPAGLALRGRGQGYGQ